MKNRAQAALEFLTTYGWAFLVILVMIGALAYFGVLDPQKFLPNKCQFETGISCERYILDTTGASELARFELKNGMPSHIWISRIQWKNNGIYQDCEAGSTVSTALNKGQLDTFECLVPATTLVAGSKFKLELRMEYNEGTAVDANFQKFMEGEVFTTPN